MLKAASKLVSTDQLITPISLPGDVTLSTGNLVIGTSGKGIDFSATSGSGTSELLADYEEGTWTPSQGGGLTVVGTFGSAGRYTKIGNMVYVNFYVEGSTSVAATAGANITTNLPFTSGTTAPFPVGIASDNANSQTVAVEGYATLVPPSANITPVGRIFVSMAYATI